MRNIFPISTSYKRVVIATMTSLTLTITALGLITHATCACGDKIEKSLLRILVDDLFKIAPRVSLETYAQSHRLIN